MSTCNICKKGTLKINPAFESSNGAVLIPIECSICGKFSINENFYTDLDAKDVSYTASCYINECARNGKPAKIETRKDLENILTIPEKNLDTKYKLFLELANDIVTKQKKMIAKTNSDMMNAIYTECWCADENELHAIMDEAIKRNHLIQTHIGINTITFEGRRFLESTSNKNSNKIFMAFHFTSEMNEQFEDTVKKAVIDASNGTLEAVRVSSSTTEHDIKIDDELISMIKASKAIIADFTGQRNAVYYEAGYAMGMGIPVIWTCRASDVDTLSFDTRQYPHIVWENEEDLYKQVSNRIKAKIL